MKKGKQPEPPGGAKNPKSASGQASRAKGDERPAKSAEVKLVAKEPEIPVDQSEDQSGRKSYRKRQVVSNWDRYESHDPDISSDHEEPLTGATKKVSTNFNLDFNDLLRDSCELKPCLGMVGGQALIRNCPLYR